MKDGICAICSKETNNLWLFNLAQIDSLVPIEGKNIRQNVCDECVSKINEAVISLSNKTAMGNALNKVGIQSSHQANNKEPMAEYKNIQNQFLAGLIKNNTLIQVDAIEGIGWRCHIKSFDNFSLIVLNEQDEEELVFKHAIKSIRPL